MKGVILTCFFNWDIIHTIKATLLKHIIEWYLGYSQIVQSFPLYTRTPSWMTLYFTLPLSMFFKSRHLLSIGVNLFSFMSSSQYFHCRNIFCSWLFFSHIKEYADHFMSCALSIFSLYLVPMNKSLDVGREFESLIANTCIFICTRCCQNVVQSSSGSSYCVRKWVPIFFYIFARIGYYNICYFWYLIKIFFLFSFSLHP